MANSERFSLVKDQFFPKLSNCSRATTAAHYRLSLIILEVLSVGTYRTRVFEQELSKNSQSNKIFHLSKNPVDNSTTTPKICYEKQSVWIEDYFVCLVAFRGIVQLIFHRESRSRIDIYSHQLQRERVVFRTQ